eukprot:scaffold6052_cov118-Cylindrotheca_fusiformis.AAC.1
MLSCIRDNNTAVSMIEKGRYEQAIVLLSNATRSLMNEVEGMTANDELEEPEAPGLDQCMVDKSVNGPQNEDHPFVYSNAIRVPSCFETEQCKETITVPSIVVFNLALAHHLLAAVPNAAQRVNLEKALRLYTLAFSLQKGEIVESNILFVLAIFSNSGVIWSCLNNPVESAKLFENVLSLLMVLNEMKDVHSPCEAMLLHGFYHNVFCQYLSDNTVTAAPAA